MSRDKIARTAGIKKQLYRNGPSHRDGADVTYSDIVKIFGFRTAKVGAWVNKVRLLGLKKILEYYILSTVKFSKILQTNVIMFAMFPLVHLD